MSTENPGPRCAALVGAYSSGKTSLFEELLFLSGATARRGTAKEGNTVGDSAPEARARSMSTELTVAQLQYLGETWSLIDCPGSVELSYDSQSAMMVADVVVVVCEPVPERAATVSRILKFLDDRAVPHLIFINKMDQAEASVRKTFEALQHFSARPLILRGIPMRDTAGQVYGMVDLVSERAWRWNAHKPSDLIKLPEQLRADESSIRASMLEALADFDDKLMEELLEDAVPPTDEIYDNLARDLQRDLVVPVFFGSAENGNGIHRLLKALRHETPSAALTAARLGIPTAGGATAQVFKTLYAGQGGKLSIARVWSGEVKEGMALGADRVGSVGNLVGRKTSTRGAAICGDVVALGRMANAATGDLLGEGRNHPRNWLPAQPPLYSFAIHADRQADEVKLTSALARLVDEDPSLGVGLSPETGQQILSGQGELHLQIALSRLKSDGIPISHQLPAVPYRETITQPASQHSRHKKQSGGHGEFADVRLEIRPLPRGDGFHFEDRITGGVVPKQYIPAVEKGVAGYLARGPLGFPVVDIAVTLADGSFHPVDSSDMAFQKAGAKAMSEAMPGCGPVLLEPVMKVTISAPSDFTPKVQRIVSTRRGQLLGFDTKDGWQGWDEVMALMPQSEIADLIIELRSQSLGLSTYASSFDHLQEFAGKEADKVVAGQAAERR